MDRLRLHDFHQDLGARFTAVNGAEAVADYGDALAEHGALGESAGLLDLSFRSRLCLTGADRVRFLHGQITNDVKRLRPGEGCYAALITAKGKMQSDLNVYVLPEELLLDFEPGLAQTVSQRLEKYIIADDVQVADVAPLYGLLSVQGPKAREVAHSLALFGEIPSKPHALATAKDAALGEVYAINHARLGTSGFDLFVPEAALAAAAEKLMAAVKSAGGQPCGWTAFETVRLEAGIPRFGADLDETNIPLEGGLESRAVSFAKGCYIGQEVISRIHTYGQVAKSLRRLRLADDLPHLPSKGDKLFHAGKEAGYITSATAAPSLKANIAFGYVRKEANQIGTELTLRTAQGESRVNVVGLPFEGREKGDSNRASR
jgi:folate-binding protein YgfZ